MTVPTSALTGERSDGLEEITERVIIRPMLTVSGAIDLFDSDLAGRGRTKRTRDSYGRTLDTWCEFCGVNPTYGGGLCGMCQADEDFANCEHCRGTSCTGMCEDEEDFS